MLFAYVYYDTINIRGVYVVMKTSNKQTTVNSKFFTNVIV